MPNGVVLILGDTANGHDPSCAKGAAHCLRVADSTEAMDVLWERGQDIEAIVAKSDLVTQELAEVLRRDWPEIRLTVD